jgi:hypothetical protein
MLISSPAASFTPRLQNPRDPGVNILEGNKDRALFHDAYLEMLTLVN